MGLFSFLTGGTRARGAPERAPATRPPAIEPAGEAAAVTETEAPAAWNFGSLTAPPPAEALPETPLVGPADPVRTAELEPKIVAALSTIFDPEIPVNIYELGLVYGIEADADSRVRVRMTLTSPACPSAQQLPSEARYKVKAVPGVADAFVDVVWEPPWTKDMMTDAARLALGLL